MNITDEDIAEFQALFKSRFNIDLDHSTARDKLLKLVRQMEIVYQPITKKQFKEHNKKNTSDKS